MNHEFEAVPDALDAWRCVHSGCLVRKSRTGQFWQERPGSRWLDVDKVPLPDCLGEPPAKDSP